MEAPSYPTQEGITYVNPEPDMEHQWVQGGQDDGRRSRKRKIAFIVTAFICCNFLLFVVAPIIALVIWFAVNDV